MFKHWVYWLPVQRACLSLVLIASTANTGFLRADAPSGAWPSDEDFNLAITDTLAVRASVQKDALSQLDPIIVSVEVKNISDNHRWLPSFNNVYLDYKLQVLDKDGKLLPKTLFRRFEASTVGYVGASAGSAGRAFAPGDTVRAELIPNLVYDMTRPGTYTIVVYVPTAPLSGPGISGPVFARSDTLRVVVRKR